MNDWSHITFVIEDYRDIVQMQEAIELATLLDDFERAEAACLDEEHDSSNRVDDSSHLNQKGKHVITFLYRIFKTDSR